ncbi:hypothetical protein L6452_03540 [Arctium lappa]|uniref:Uncharacterized protein n=1 Tax=Arctium lappa TaxID=4217 RepID=A0ACB9FN04_ARCLA|nr:hypothetical protein L6452_03540 [Arctium lappa]
MQQTTSNARKISALEAVSDSADNSATSYGKALYSDSITPWSPSSHHETTIAEASSVVNLCSPSPRMPLPI